MLGRRDFLKLTTAAVAAIAAGGVSARTVSWPIWMRRGKEEFRFDAATQKGFEVARYILRDVRGGNVRGYPHLNLLQSLAAAQSYFAYYGVHARFIATSGLRLPGTNARTENAARNSFHMPDKNGWFFACDFIPEKIDLAKAAGWMRYAGIGGVGMYFDKNFLHVDVGPDRVWRRG